LNLKRPPPEATGHSDLSGGSSTLLRLEYTTAPKTMMTEIIQNALPAQPKSIGHFPVSAFNFALIEKLSVPHKNNRIQRKKQEHNQHPILRVKSKHAQIRHEPIQKFRDHDTLRLSRISISQVAGFKFSALF
jgi:hypothetical protein